MEEKILKALQEKGAMRPGDIAAAVGVDKEEAAKVIKKLAKEGNWEAVYGVWLSTFILTPIAVYLTWKATNDSALLDTDWYAGRIKALRDRIAPAAARLTDKLKFRIRNRHGKANDAQ